MNMDMYMDNVKEVSELIELAVLCNVEKTPELFYDMVCLVYCGVLPGDEYDMDVDVAIDIEDDCGDVED